MTTETQYPQPVPLSDTVAAALRRAFNLGQTYWQQADSESYSQNAKSDITRSKFDALLEETTAAVAAIPSPEGEPSDAAVELAAKAVYRLFIGADDHPWVEDGNSLKQCDARRYARAAIAAQPQAGAQACDCPNIGACDGSCAPYVGKRDDPRDPMLAEAWEMAKRLEPAASEMMRKLCKRLREDDRMLSQTIDEREERQQFIDDLLDALHGPDRHEWTSAYGFNDAMEDALERLAALEAATPSPAEVHGEVRALIEQCRDALAEELAAWDIDPPLHHVKTAHDACEAWLAKPQPKGKCISALPDAQPPKRPDDYCADNACRAVGQCARAQAPAPAPMADKLHVTAWECHGCGHRGIDDSDDAAEACSDCDWRGPCPDEDVCPGCGREETMVSACPKCGDRYYIKAEADIAIPAAAPAPAVGAEMKPRGFLLHWPSANGRRLIWDESDAAGVAIGCPVEPVFSAGVRSKPPVQGSQP